MIVHNPTVRTRVAIVGVTGGTSTPIEDPVSFEVKSLLKPLGPSLRWDDTLLFCDSVTL